MTNQKPCREELLHQINVASFALDDTKLFLDTHPRCQEALEYFAKMQGVRKTAMKEYSKYYGPLNMNYVCTDADYWNWINAPWPWQKGGC